MSYIVLVENYSMVVLIHETERIGSEINVALVNNREICEILEAFLRLVTNVVEKMVDV